MVAGCGYQKACVLDFAVSCCTRAEQPMCSSLALSLPAPPLVAAASTKTASIHTTRSLARREPGIRRLYALGLEGEHTS